MIKSLTNVLQNYFSMEEIDNCINVQLGLALLENNLAVITMEFSTQLSEDLHKAIIYETLKNNIESIPSTAQVLCGFDINNEIKIRLYKNYEYIKIEINIDRSLKEQFLFNVDEYVHSPEQKDLLSKILNSNGAIRSKAIFKYDKSAVDDIFDIFVKSPYILFATVTNSAIDGDIEIYKELKHIPITIIDKI